MAQKRDMVVVARWGERMKAARKEPILKGERRIVRS